ncbi:MAG: LysR family transcriptional regulator [Pseudomonadota bacterium]
MDSQSATRPSLRQLQYFVAVADHRGFGVAAAALAVSQPSLSKQLASMEMDLGVRLFERTSRSVKLTTVGETLLPKARTILQHVRELHVTARGAMELFGNRLSIGVLPSIGAYFMPPASRTLHRLYPQLRLVVEEGSTSQLLGMLKEGRLDTVIGTPTNDPAYESVALFEETLWACGAHDDDISKADGPLSLSELTGRPLLSLSAHFTLAEIVDRLADRCGAYVSRDYQGGSLDAVRQMAVMGAGVAVLPSLYALAEAVRDPEFTVRRIDHPDAIHPIVLLWRRGTAIDDHCRQLARHLVEVKGEIRAARGNRFH